VFGKRWRAVPFRTGFDCKRGLRRSLGDSLKMKIVSFKGKKGKNAFSRFPRFSARRAFSSTLIAMLAVVVVSGIAAVVLVSSSQQRALLASFEARKVANHFDESAAFFNASLRDALFDFEYGRNGCQPNPKNFADLGRAYVAAAASELNGSGVDGSVENPVFGLTAPNDVAPLPGFDEAFVANASFGFFVSRGSAFKNESVFLEQRIDANYTGKSVPGLNAWVANSSGFVVNVPCT
jgi:hypothetical protein